MSASGQGSAIYATFIDRKNKREYPVEPRVTSLSFGADARQFTAAFDFEIQFGPYEQLDINSHDFVEFWFWNGNKKHQVGVGFTEDFVKKTNASGNVIQGNGRDFLAQLMAFPFKARLYKNGPSYKQFLNSAVQDTYIIEYLKFRNRSTNIIDLGIYTGPMIFTDSATAPRAQVIQEYADLAMNLIYQDRLGRLVVYGRKSRQLKSDIVGQTLDAQGDLNVVDMQIRQNYSKVYSSCSVLFQGQDNLDSPSPTATVASSAVFNSDPRAKGLSQPLIKIFSTQDLVGTAGSQSADFRRNELAASFIRKSNQNLSMVVVIADSPFYQTNSGQHIPYEIGQIWKIKNDSYKINSDHKLVGIHYQQSSDQLQVQLAFVEPDTLS